MPAPTMLVCPDCGKVARAKVLTAHEVRDLEHWPGDDFRMGRYETLSNPKIDYYRRVRTCGACGELYVTAELNEAVVNEVIRLRVEVRRWERRFAKARGEVRSLSEKLAMIKAVVDGDEDTSKPA